MGLRVSKDDIIWLSVYFFTALMFKNIRANRTQKKHQVGLIFEDQPMDNNLLIGF